MISPYWQWYWSRESNISCNLGKPYILAGLFLEAKPGLKIIKKDLQKVFHFATSQTNFLFNGNMYDQIDWNAMGLPLAPILANIFMMCYKKGWIRDYN